MVESYIIAVLICIFLIGKISFHVFIEKKVYLFTSKSSIHMLILEISLFIFFSWKVFIFPEY